MTKLCTCLICVFVWMPSMLRGQLTFPERVDRAFGASQVLVNGIQFSNQYILIEGNPYWLDDSFRSGSVCINGQWYEPQGLRYNMYSGRVEIEYLTPEGHLNQIITVGEQLSGFQLGDQLFRRMQPGSEESAFYQVLASGNWNCYVAWRVEVRGGGSAPLEFGDPERSYWMAPEVQGTEPIAWIRFHDRRSLLRAFPERKREFRQLLKQRGFFFEQATNREMVELVEAIFGMLEAGRGA